MAIKPKPKEGKQKQPATSSTSPAELTRGRPEPCDRCGYSKTALSDEASLRVRSIPLYRTSAHLADSQFEVVVPMGIKGDRYLYFCAHHYHKFEVFIAGQGYRVRSWK